MKILLMTTLAALCSFSAQAAEPLYGFGGGRQVVKSKHLVPQMKDGEGYGEKYTFDANFGEKGSMYFSYTISNMGFGDHKMEAKGRITIDGKSYKWKKKLDEDEWSFKKAPFSITAGPATMSGNPKALRFQVESGGKGLDLVFTPIANPWRPKDGRIKFGRDRNVTDYTLWPLCNVTGKANVGDGWVELKGVGYGTRTWSELAVYEQARWTMDFRGISGDKTVYIRELGATGEFGYKRIPYLIITDGKELVIESFEFANVATEVMTDTKHENKYKVPENFTLLGRDSEDGKRQFRGKVSKKKLRRRKDVLEDMNSALRMVASRYSKPVRYEYDSDYVIEVKIGEEVRRFEGVGNYEFYYWNK